MATPRKLIRCAIYTRKSTEDGLEQEYNSLDAQYDACAAYAKSQRHEGWSVIKERYDDGGFSGGNMHRPALKRLLADIADGRIDIILVYKIDRLTRSLSDFAKIVEILDRREASFVSITQSFNTTTSMGRLTLNMLLSFAQFEREVTGERIRDKIAASKRKGIWMGGPVPLGYDVIERKLVVNESEAQLVRHIMQRYIALGSVRELVAELKSDGYRTKIQIRTSTGHKGGCAFQRGTLYHLLSNRIYRGMIVHKGEAFEGEHEAIVAQELWTEVQAKLAARSQGGNTRNPKHKGNLLTGLMFDGEGRAMVPTHSQKGSRRFSYYATRPELAGEASIWRVKAQDIEAIVRSEVAKALRMPSEVQRLLHSEHCNAEWINALIAACRDRADQIERSANGVPHNRLAAILHKVELHETRIVTTLDNQKLIDALELPFAIPASTSNLVIDCPAIKVRRGQQHRLIIPPAHASDAVSNRDPKLIAMLAEARTALALIKSDPNKSVRVIAAAHKRCAIRLGKLTRLACLAPEIVIAINEGRQPLALTPRRLLDADLPLCWQKQKQVLGFA